MLCRPRIEAFRSDTIHGHSSGENVELHRRRRKQTIVSVKLSDKRTENRGRDFACGFSGFLLPFLPEAGKDD